METPSECAARRTRNSTNRPMHGAPHDEQDLDLDLACHEDGANTSILFL
jgi:hypothetical protein